MGVMIRCMSSFSIYSLESDTCSLYVDDAVHVKCAACIQEFRVFVIHSNKIYGTIDVYFGSFL